MNNQSGPPFFYNYQNVIDANHFPIHSNSIMTRYFQRYLLQKAISVYKWELPDTWAKNFLLYCLYCWGFVAVFETDKFGVIYQPCGLRGYDVFYRPTNAVIANPLINRRLEPKIGTQCELIRLQPDYGGIMDIVTHYATMMAIATETAVGNLFKVQDVLDSVGWRGVLPRIRGDQCDAARGLLDFAQRLLCGQDSEGAGRWCGCSRQRCRSGSAACCARIGRRLPLLARSGGTLLRRRLDGDRGQ